jgi:hypothetical protein
MKLETESAGTLQDPREREIADALSTLDGFAVLSHDELTYLQTAGTASDGFVLEHQAGSTEEHHTCPDRLSLERVTAAFIAYAKGDTSWRTAFRWNKLDV